MTHDEYVQRALGQLMLQNILLMAERDRLKAQLAQLEEAARGRSEQ
jgi:hypothetical protein